MICLIERFETFNHIAELILVIASLPWDEVQGARQGETNSARLYCNPGHGGPWSVPSLAFVFHPRQPSVRVPPKSQHLVLSLPAARYDKRKT
jgi:hypothetical protein